MKYQPDTTDTTDNLAHFLVEVCKLANKKLKERGFPGRFVHEGNFPYSNNVTIWIDEDYYVSFYDDPKEKCFRLETEIQAGDSVQVNIPYNALSSNEVAGLLMYNYLLLP